MMHLPTGQMGAATANTGASHAGERIFSPVRSTIDRTQPPQGPLYRAAAPVSLSKKSFVNFFDCACERVFCHKAKYETRKTVKTVFRTLADPIRGGPCPLELPCCSVSAASTLFFDSLGGAAHAAPPWFFM